MSVAFLYKRSIKALHFAKQNGWANLYRLLHRKAASKNGLFGKARVIDPYEFVVCKNFGSPITANAIPSNTINWFIPKIGKGSGGHLNIFRFVRGLEERGFECRLIIVGDLLPQSSDTVKKNIGEWFFPLQADVFIGLDNEIPPAIFSIATSWQTAYAVKAFQSTQIRCYFVQDFEPWFYPAGTDSVLAENTYHFGFHGITAGSWLAEKLRTEYGMQTCALGFSYDRNLYSPSARKSAGTKRVFFYARPPTARRAFELGLLVLREVCRKIPSAEVVMAGWDVSNYEIPFPCRHAGLMELTELNDLYHQCDVALVLSCSNLSLLPVELMAAGVPVVSNSAPYTRWLLNADNSLLANPDVESLAAAVVEILEKPARADELRQGGIEFARSTCWEKEGDKLAQHLSDLNSGA